MNHLRLLIQHYGNSEGRALYRLLMEELFGFSQTDLLLCKDSKITAEQQEELDEIVKRMLKNEPIQYILGYTQFCGHRFSVKPGCLIPRPETEELVHLITNNHESSTLLDIGTGSGCIAVSLAIEGFKVSAMDISQDALDIAMQNASDLNTEVEFILEDILHPETKDRKWDIIVSNPPYICDREAASMDANVLDYEPHLALFVPDDDPLVFYRAIAEYGTTHINDGGYLYFEINRLYGCITRDMLISLGYKDVKIIKDQYGKERIISAHL